MAHSTWRAPAVEPGERVGHRQPEVVVAVHRHRHVAQARHELVQAAEHLGVLVGHRVADRVGHVDRGGALVERDLDHLGHELHVRARAVLGRELHVVGVLARLRHRRAGLALHVLAGGLELALDVDVAGGDEGVDPRALGVLDRRSRRRRCPASTCARARRSPGPCTSRAMACTESKSPGEVIGKPASMMSTPSRASWCAISTFSCRLSAMPGDCSPSRSVVSKILTRSCSLRPSVMFALFVVLSVFPLSLRLAAATRYSPRGGRRRGRSRPVRRDIAGRAVARAAAVTAPTPLCRCSRGRAGSGGPRRPARAGSVAATTGRMAPLSTHSDSGAMYSSSELLRVPERRAC